MDTSNRLRIATRIHFALLRQYGEHVEIGSLIDGGAEVREALWVCDASGDAELVALAQQLRRATRAGAVKPPAGPRPAAPQGAAPDSAWSRHSTGFGPSSLGALDEPAASPASWLHPSSWLKLGSAARHH